MFNGGAGAFGGASLDDLAHQHEEGHHPCRLVLTGGEGGKHGDGDQLVDAQGPGAKVLDGGQDDRIPENDRADQTAGAGDGVALLEEPIHEECVEHEYDPYQRLPEPHRRVLVVVPAHRARFIVLVLVPAQERSDLHGFNESGSGVRSLSRLRLLCLWFGDLTV